MAGWRYLWCHCGIGLVPTILVHYLRAFGTPTSQIKVLEANATRTFGASGFLVAILVFFKGERSFGKFGFMFGLMFCICCLSYVCLRYFKLKFYWRFHGSLIRKGSLHGGNCKQATFLLYTHIFCSIVGYNTSSANGSSSISLVDRACEQRTCRLKHFFYGWIYHVMWAMKKSWFRVYRGLYYPVFWGLW